MSWKQVDKAEKLSKIPYADKNDFKKLQENQAPRKQKYQNFRNVSTVYNCKIVHLEKFVYCF